MPGSARKRIVLVGGGHAHLFTLARLPELIRQGASITLVTDNRYQTYSGMAPGILSGSNLPEELRFDLPALAQQGGGACVVERAVSLEPKRRLLFLASGPPLPYDLISFNIGSTLSVPESPLPDTVTPVKPFANLLLFQERVKNLLAKGIPRLVIIGGGAAGVELAGNLERLVRHEGGRGYVTVVTGGRILERFPHGAGELARQSLEARNIQVMEGRRVVRAVDGGALLDNGELLPFQEALLATGIAPPPLFRSSALPVAEDGSLLVTDTLQCGEYPEILGGGDCISLTGRRLERVGLHAVREAPVIYANLTALLTGKRLIRFTPQSRYLQLLNLGDGTALFIRGNMVYRGKSALFLTEYLDSSFMRRYQSG